jgi:hypothetical protein
MITFNTKPGPLFLKQSDPIPPYRIVPVFLFLIQIAAVKILQIIEIKYTFCATLDNSNLLIHVN